jgi:hypothetical protein
VASQCCCCFTAKRGSMLGKPRGEHDPKLHGTSTGHAETCNGRGNSVSEARQEPRARPGFT